MPVLCLKNGINYVETLPYNKLSGSKYALLMRKYSPGFDESREVNTGEKIFACFGITAKNVNAAEMFGKTINI